MNLLRTLISNNIPDTAGNQYAAIIGSTPSLGARSPLLWNYVYQSIGSQTVMLPLDVVPDKVQALINYLEEDTKFIGGAIAVPYKMAAYNILKKNIASEAKLIGAINCIYRDKNGKLAGANTDGEGAVKSIQKLIGNRKLECVLILGTGATAKSISAYIHRITNKSTKVIVAYNINKMKDEDILLFGIHKQISYHDVADIISQVDLLINATILGGMQAEGISPLNEKNISFLPKTACIYEVNYHPESSKLLELSRKYMLSNINGKEMNLLQAVLAFEYVNPSIVEKMGRGYVHKKMKEA